MKPKTKLQQEVWNLHQKLLSINEHEPYMISKHEFYYTTHYKNLICLECNHQWKPNQLWQEELVGVECPSCKKNLKKIKTENGGQAVRIITYGHAQVVDRFQVIRYFSCWKNMSKKKKPVYSTHRLFEEWTDYEKGKRVIVGQLACRYGDGFHGTYEVRYINNSGWRSNDYDIFASDYNFPRAEFIPIFQKYTLDCFDHECDYRVLMRKIQSCSKIETLLKTKQKELLQHAVHKDNKYYSYWPQIKIAMRQGYQINDPGIWYDYLDLLRGFGKDIHSPKYICPENLKAEHDRYVEKRRIQREQEKIQDLQKQNENYIKRMSRFLSLEFIDGDLSIKPLQNVDEFKQEGKELKHCVFTNNYHLKTNSLLLSARINGVRTETIEIEMITWSIVQARGIHNDNSKHHDRILELMKKSIPAIRKASQYRKSKPLKQSA
ncbi:PcfJ domain-containing protein [Flavobacterium sedimenticola]|uniref:PcfJ domain-containing protein n=1 Tax=Flavobacterium sedimenticola TaxID=3043286 RepID=A0ABT6XMN9_9FLAO|nr:PcfJ domain-containing protein [Flavobacterium sedimenticola]MDI9256345.1 PcfJ domain-containing protein [Flavobacterium sedimenticola]